MEHRLLNNLKANPLNPRGEVLDDESLHELAASIRVHGVLQPILVTPDGTIIAGHRRVRASEIAGAKSIPVIVRDLDETAQIQVMLIENLQRASLTALQTAKAYKLLCEKGLSIRQVSMAIGYHTSSISRHLDILQLPEELHSCFDGEFAIPLGGIRYLLELDEGRRLTIGLKCKNQGWSIGRLRQVVARCNPNRHARQMSANMLDQIFEKIEEGCYTAEDIATCSECGGRRFPRLSVEQIEAAMDELVKSGRADWRKRGGRGDRQRGDIPDICVPSGTPFGSSLDLGGREIEEDDEAA